MADDVAQWLDRLGLGKYAQAFEENDIDAEVLSALTDEDLKELGLSLGHSRKLLRAIAERRAEPAPGRAPREPPARSAEGERRQLTVLFCDLAGSTELSSKLDPEDLRAILRAYQDACSGAVARYEGYVAKFMGDGVYAYFGYPAGHEDDAARAINAGLAIVEAVQGLKEDLSVRIGIATGLVVVGDIIGESAAQEAAITGETPNIAARLQEIAEPNTIVIGESTHALAGAMFETSALGKRDLKGFAEPVGAWAVARPRRAESRFEATRGERLTELVGREEEMEILLRRWRRATSGEGQVVLISGEPGIGKSRLARELLDRVAGAPHYRLRYQCSPYHTNSALHPVIEQLERAARFEAGDGARARLEKLEAALAASGQPIDEKAPLFASLLSLPAEGRYPPRDLSPQRRKQLTLQALVDQLSGLARRQPVLLVLEDAHWIDPTTLELMELTVERLPEMAALMLLTYRPEFQAPWIGRPRVTHMALGRLERRDGARMVERVWTREGVPVELRDRIAEQTDGVPLFIEEVTKSVMEAALGSGDGRVAIEVPTTIQDSLEARLERLGPAKEIAQTGAVIGREFGYELLAAVAGIAEDALREGLGRLVGSELVFGRGEAPEASYTFKHALLQETAYNSLLRGRRMELHARIAAALEARQTGDKESEPELLAHHFTEAGLPESAVPYWLRAGESALQRSALVEGVAHLERGIRVSRDLGPGRDRDKIQIVLHLTHGSAMRRIHGPMHPVVAESYQTAYPLAQRIDDASLTFPAFAGLVTSRTMRGEVADARERAQKLLELAGDDAARRGAAHMVMAETLWMLGENEPAVEHAERACAIYDPAVHGQFANLLGRDFRVFAGSFLAMSLLALGYPDRGLAVTREVIESIPGKGRESFLSFALLFDCVVLMLRGDAEAVHERATQLADLVERERYSTFVAWARMLEAWSRGRLDDGYDCCEEVEGCLPRLGTPVYWEPMLKTLLAEDHLRWGRAGEALAKVDESVELCEGSGLGQFASPAQSARGEVLAKTAGADRGEVESCYVKALATARAQSARLWELRAAARLARLWHSQSKTAEARGLLAPIYGWFTEGFDTADLKEAKALLDELG